MTEKRFKIGDRVRVIKRLDDIPVGSFGTVMDTDTGAFIRVAIDGIEFTSTVSTLSHYQFWPFFDSELELADGETV